MLKDTLGYKLVTILDKIKNYSKHTFSEIGITHGNFIVLLYISENEGVTQAKLAEISRKDKNIISRNIDVLEEKGFVIRSRGELDRRSYTLFLTDKGKNVISTHEHLIINGEQNVLKNLTSEEIKTLYILLNKVTK
ncbi:MarR family winged helix-turn-helix transcriptional regulator [Gemella cuniculi]|uniref:MarR family winged helix-turn-helix transcriptional regulator n=1 Tax=Gemella cuniculi TaxID=150240 RepID=UPI0003FE5A69|nr:MarR family transcriptional regulator [Gemella cuniculi]